MRAANVSELHVSLFEDMYGKALIEGKATINEEDIISVSYDEVRSFSKNFSRK